MYQLTQHKINSGTLVLNNMEGKNIVTEKTGQVKI